MREVALSRLNSSMLSRRAFLRFLVAAPIVGPAVVKALASAPTALVNPLFSGELGVWRGVTIINYRQAAREQLKRWLAEEIDAATFEAFNA